ncbi:TPA: hypothetical protein QB404_000701 [Pasteurella multocida]|nr:hypothetical protein [Pasteurella multocida]
MSESISSRGMLTALLIGAYFSCKLISDIQTSLLQPLKMPLMLIATPLVLLTAHLLCRSGVL